MWGWDSVPVSYIHDLRLMKNFEDFYISTCGFLKVQMYFIRFYVNIELRIEGWRIHGIKMKGFERAIAKTET